MLDCLQSSVCVCVCVCVQIQAVEERLMDWADHLIEAVPDLDRSKLHAVNQITQVQCVDTS